ncbi:GAF domain-containing protein [Pseudoalteromonas sp. NEC-BIFX-2020_015]|uniref:two-component regulator propeller domain-containing protein n=1 Tax=Pseudoalteromonas sp. NEC-BIFX-2020_015 TaxID=2729544 RepID=UPI001461485C|nr:GAF domain-containing protein [Pseudoalteromonas sp. NEC-BIFX-2020_015]
MIFLKHNQFYSFVWCIFFSFFLLATLFNNSVTAAPSIHGTKLTDFKYAQPLFTTIDDNAKIVNGAITSGIEANNGIFWFGTQNGLVSFDGVSFTRFEHQPGNKNSPAADYIVAIAQDQDGGIWLATRTSGLTRFDPISNEFIHISTQSQNMALMSNTLRTLKIDSNNQLWVGHELGVEKLDLNSKQSTHYILPTQGEITYHFFETNDGAIWACSTKGVFVKGINDTHFSSISQLKNLDIRSVYQDPTGTYWLGSRSGLWFWDGVSDPVSASSDNSHVNSNAYVRSIIALDNNQVWVATYGEGIWVFNLETKQWLNTYKHDPSVATSLVYDEIGTLFLSKNGTILIGTWGAGLQILNSNTVNNFAMLRYTLLHDKGLSYANVRTIFELENGTILVGTTGNGVDVIEPKNGRLKTINSDLSGKKISNVVSLAEQKDGTLWAGTTSSGLVKIHLKEGHFSQLELTGLEKGAILRLLVLNDQSLAVGTAKGVCIIKRGSRHCESLIKKLDGKKMNDTVTSMIQDNANSLWIGSHNGLYRKRADQTVLDHFQTDNLSQGLSHNYVLGMVVDQANNMWLTTSTGFDKVTDLEQIQPIFNQMKGEFPIGKQSPGANMLIDKDQRIWSATSIIDLSTKQFRLLNNGYGVDIGVAWLGSYTKLRSGLMVFGGTKGVLIVDPNKFPFSITPSKLNTVRLKVNGESAPLSRLNNFILKPEEASFNIQIAVNELLHKSLVYEYQLLPDQPQWRLIDADAPYVQLSKLSPQDYTLTTRAYYKNNTAQIFPSVLSFTVQPTLIQTLWFRLLIVGISLIILGLIFRWRIGIVKAKAIKLEELVSQRTREIQVINQIGQQFTLQLLLDELLNDIYAQINEIFQADRFGIGIINNDKNCLEFNYAVERGVRYVAYERSMEEPGQLAVYAVEHNQSVLINDYDTQFHHYYPEQDNANHQLHSGSKEIKALSMMYVPMQHNGKMLGVISIQSVKPNSYHAHDLTLLESLASYVTIALSNAQSHQHLLEMHQTLQNNIEELKHTQEQLIMHEKMAQLGQLVAGIAHEVNTPIGITITASSILQDYTHQLQKHFSANTLSRSIFNQYFERADQSLILIKTNAERAAELVQRFKQIAVENSFEIAEPINIEEFIYDIIKSHASTIAAKKVQVDINIVNKGKLISCPNALSQVLFCIINNSLTHAFNDVSNKVIHFKIEFTQTQCLIDIADSGVGIAADAIDKIFDPFYTTNRSQGGTGLGLSIAFNLIHQVLQGTIECESEIGVGTTFSLCLPINIRHNLEHEGQ